MSVETMALRRDLNPRQEEVCDELLLLGRERPLPARDLGRTYRERLSSELQAVSSEMRPGHRLVLSKHTLSHVHSCEGLFSALNSVEFEWSPTNVRGRVAHRALEELIVSQYGAAPLSLAQSALDELSSEEDSYGPGGYLRTMRPGQRQDLVRDVNDILVKFIADWPRVTPSWLPRVESPVKVAFGQVKLQAKFDLCLGVPTRSSARTFIVDFKTGIEQPDHAQDIRFYALLDTIRSGVPPYRVATYYLDSGTWRAEDVDEGVLDAAMRRVVDGARLMARVEVGGPSRLTPGPACRFCPARSSCEEGKRWLEADATAPELP